MDINTLRTLLTVVSFVVFVGIVVWAWRNRNNDDFIDAANLPFEEDKKSRESK